MVLFVCLGLLFLETSLLRWVSFESLNKDGDFLGFGQ